ncbi:MAG: family 43 glycosylhydrolase [Eubacterium sp.]
MKKQIFNPYLPHYEYIPDGEPRVFDNRLYIFGSHDKFGGKWYCENDYVTWSAPLDDLSDWRYEGVIYKKTQDNRKGNLYAPDVVKGPDGRYYLFYSKDDTSVIDVAVCDTPAGQYEFYGEVSYKNGKILGDDETEYFMFDPSVLIDDNGRIWLYSGSSARGTTTKIKRNMAGCTVTELEADMKTVKTPPKVILHGSKSWYTDAYFEGPSVRKIKDLYYIVYPTRDNTGLHYATSNYPDRDFVHRGPVHSTSDFGLNGHTLLNPAYPRGNNHGGMVELNGEWYIFDHRMTNGTAFSRQGVAEKIEIQSDGSINQVEATSCGLNGKPLKAEGTYPAYIACNLMGKRCFGKFQIGSPYITQDGQDGDENTDCYITNIKKGFTAGFKYFDFDDGRYTISVTVRGKGNGKILVSTCEDSEILGETKFSATENWKTFNAKCRVKKGKKALFFTYNGHGSIDLLNFIIKKEG